jgi:hypothetical protein
VTKAQNYTPVFKHLEAGNPCGGFCSDLVIMRITTAFERRDGKEIGKQILLGEHSCWRHDLRGWLNFLESLE